MEKLPNKKIEKNEKELGAEILSSEISENDILEIIGLYRTIFPTMVVEEKEIREALLSDGVQVVLRDAEKIIKGCVSSLPHNEAVKFLKEYDKDIVEEKDTLYIEAIMILDEYRSLKNLLEMWNTFVTEAKNRGYKKITSHTRVSQGLSKISQKRFGAKFIRRIDNWCDYKEPFDYLEFEI